MEQPHANQMGPQREGQKYAAGSLQRNDDLVNDTDDIDAPTPIFCILRLTVAFTVRWTIKVGDVPIVFLHAAHVWPPREYCANSNIPRITKQ